MAIPIPTTVPRTFSELCRTKFGKDRFLETVVRREGAFSPCLSTLAPSIAVVGVINWKVGLEVGC
jgi:hypothetical protein